MSTRDISVGFRKNKKRIAHCLNWSCAILKNYYLKQLCSECFTNLKITVHRFKKFLQIQTAHGFKNKHFYRQSKTQLLLTSLYRCVLSLLLMGK